MGDLQVDPSNIAPKPQLGMPSLPTTTTTTTAITATNPAINANFSAQTRNGVPVPNPGIQRAVIPMKQIGMPMEGHEFYRGDYDRDGNGRNNLNRFSLTAEQVRLIE